MRQVSGNTLQQVEKFKYLGVVFTSDWRRSEEIDTRIDKSAGVLSLCSHKMRAFKHRKTVSFQSVFVPILTYGRESWVMTERILTQVQAPKMGFLRRVHCVTKGCTEVRLGPGKETSLAPPYLNLRSFGSKCTALKKNLRHCWDFLAPLNDSAPGHCAPLVTPLVWHYRDNLAALKLAEPWMSNHFSELREHNYVSSAQGRSQRGAVVPGPPFEIGSPHFSFGPPLTAYIQYYILKIWPPLLAFGPSFCYLAPLLLNPGDGPGSAMCPECPTKDWWRKSCCLNPRESDPDVVQGPVGLTTSPTLLGPILMWSQQNYLKLLLIARYSKSYGCCPTTLPMRKSRHENKWNEWHLRLFIHRCLKVLS